MDYIGTDTADTTFKIQEECNEISQLSQVYEDGKAGRSQIPLSICIKNI